MSEGIFFLIIMWVLAAVVIPYFTPYIKDLIFGSKTHAPNISKKAELTSNKTVNELRQVESQKSKGILAASKPNGEKMYISESDRACIIGPPGTGKTSFLINQIYEWTDTGRSFVCLDIKPEIYEITKRNLELKGYKIIVYNPTSPIDNYDFLQDLESPETIGEFASALIPSEQAENAVFNDTAKDLLDALINHVKSRKESAEKPATLADVYDFIKKYDNAVALFNDLKNSRSSHTKEIINSLSITASNERLLGSVFATFNSQLNFMRYENVRKSLSGGFSLSELSKPKVALFLQFEEVKMKTIGHLFSVFVGHLLRYLITNSKERDPVFCLLDEIGNAGVIHDLTGKLNTIRSRNMPTWMYWQNTEQMQKYGVKADEGVNIIMGSCDYQMCFRLNDSITAKWFSDRIGTHIIRNRSYSYTSSVETSSEGNTTSLQREEVIFPHEIQRLRDSEVVTIYRGIAWKGVAVPYWSVKAEEVNTPPTPKKNQNKGDIEAKAIPTPKWIEESKEAINWLIDEGKKAIKKPKKKE